MPDPLILSPSPEALVHSLGEIGSNTINSLSASVFDNTFLSESNGNGSSSNGNSHTNTSNAANNLFASPQSNTNSVIEHSVNYQDIDVGILMHEPSLILIIAVLLEMFLPLSQGIKLTGLTGIFRALGNKVNRPSISAGQRAFAGVVLPCLIISVLLFLVLTLDLISGFDSLIALVVLVFLLDLKFPQDQSILVYRSLNEGFKDKAKEVLAPMVLRETSMLSTMGIAKAASESAILRIFSGWFAVMIWYLFFGLEGAMFMQIVNILARTYNYKLKGNYQFGKTLFRLQQIMLAIPAAVLMVCLVCSKHPWRHFVYGLNGAKTYPAPISGMVLGAVGGSLNLSLGGPRYYQGNIMRLPSVGGTQDAETQSILYAMRKIRMCGIILLVLAVLLGLNF